MSLKKKPVIVCRPQLPEVTAAAVLPTLTTGPKFGAKSTKTPVGVKVLLSADALHNSALTVPAAAKVTPLL
jgi:hypothetical protein